MIHLFSALFFLLGSVFGADLVAQPEGKWGVYKTSFNQVRSTPLQSLSFSGRINNLTEFWELIDGDKEFLETNRVDYDIFDLSRAPFSELSSENLVSFQVLSGIQGVLVSFLTRDSASTGSHRFDALLEEIIRGPSDPALKSVFGFSVCRQYGATIVKLWTAAEVHRPFYKAIKALLGHRFGLAREHSIRSICRRILNSTAYSLMQVKPDNESSSEDEHLSVDLDSDSSPHKQSAKVDPNVSFADILRKNFSSAVAKEPAKDLVASNSEDESEDDSIVPASDSEDEDDAETAAVIEALDEFNSTDSSNNNERDELSAFSTKDSKIILEPLVIIESPRQNRFVPSLSPVGLTASQLRFPPALTHESAIIKIIDMEITDKDLIDLHQFIEKIKVELNLK